MRVDIIRVCGVRNLLHGNFGDEKTVFSEFFGDEVKFLGELILGDGEKIGEDLVEIGLEW